MKKYMNKVLVVLLLLVTVSLIHADLANELLFEAKINQFDKAMSNQAKNEQREKELELEALLLIDSCRVIDDCVKNVKFLKLKNVYDKMKVDPLYTRPTKDQIEEWRNIILDHILKAKIDNKNEKESNAYSKRAIKNGLALGASFACMMTSLIWGSNIIRRSTNANDNNYLARYAIDAGLFIGFPLSTVLLLKFALQLVANDPVEILQKMNSILLLFEQLNDIQPQK